MINVRPIIDMLLDGRTDEAILALLKLDRKQRQDREMQANDLPPMVRIKPLKSIDVSCPTCKAKPGKRCYRLTSRGPYGTPTNEHMPNFHRARVEMMKEANT